MCELRPPFCPAGVAVTPIIAISCVDEASVRAILWQKRVEMTQLSLVHLEKLSYARPCELERRSPSHPLNPDFSVDESPKGLVKPVCLLA